MLCRRRTIRNKVREPADNGERNRSTELLVPLRTSDQ